MVISASRKKTNCLTMPERREWFKSRSAPADREQDLTFWCELSAVMR